LDENDGGIISSNYLEKKLEDDDFIVDDGKIN